MSSWVAVAAIGTVETDNGESTPGGVHGGANAAGAEGPMQFPPAIFRLGDMNSTGFSGCSQESPRLGMQFWCAEHRGTVEAWRRQWPPVEPLPGAVAKHAVRRP